MPTELERELLPCPFCGTAEPQVVEQYAGTKQSQWSVICNGHWCDASVSSDGSGSLESAIETWNRRTDAAALQVQQPGAQAVAWHTDDHLTDKSATTYDPVIADRWRAKGWPVTPHYTNPQPPSIPDPSDEDIDGALTVAFGEKATTGEAEADRHWRDLVRDILTTDRARLRERLK